MRPQSAARIAEVMYPSIKVWTEFHGRLVSAGTQSNLIQTQGPENDS